MNPVLGKSRNLRAKEMIAKLTAKTLEVDRSKFATILSCRNAALCACLVACLAMPSRAQRGGGSTGGGGARPPSGGTSGGPVGRPASPSPPVYGGPSYSGTYPGNVPAGPIMTEVQPLPKPVAVEDENCLPWRISSGQDRAVSVTRLKVPSKARSEYQKACEANGLNRFEEAEKHARNAISKFDGYSAAWVMLGVVMEEQKKSDEARDSCVHAMSIDSKYLPAYLCQAEFATRKQDWEQVSNLANSALGLNLAGDAYAYYYRATALYHTNNLADAKKNALQAAVIDTDHNDVPLYFLLAQIYEAEGDKAGAAAQLHLILKHKLDRPQEEAAKRYLSTLEAQPEAK